jgi:iron(III) transport system substrate-binding protein
MHVVSRSVTGKGSGTCGSSSPNGPNPRGHPWRAAPALALLVVVGLVSAACGSGSTNSSGGSGSTPGQSETLTLYNAQHEQTTNALVAAFTKATGIKVRVDNDNEDDFTARIELEGNRSPADLFYTENSNWLQQLDDRGLLTKVDAATLANVPEADSATNGGWVGVSSRISVLVYNPSKVSASQLPTSVLGLADPGWKGKIEIAPSETDFWPIVSSIARVDGKATALAWLKGLRANAGNGATVPDNETIVSDVSQGTTDLSVINHYYFYRLKAELGTGSVHAEIAYFAPHDVGYLEDISGAAILKSSQHKAAAQKFLAFLTSDAGQKVLAAGDSFEYPIHPGVAANSELVPSDHLQPSSFTPAELGTGLDAKKLMQESGLI